MPRSKFIFEPYYYPFDPNQLVTIPQFFTKKECKKIIKMGEEAGLAPARVGDAKISEDNNYSNEEHRKSEISWIKQTEDSDWMWTKLHNEIIQTNYQYWGFNLKFMDEDAQYTVYNGDGGHFDYHVDNGQGQLSVRKLSIVVNLNDPKDWEGGELQTYKEVNAEQALGNMHIFPSYLLHRVTPVTKGIRKSLVLWSGGEYYK